MEGNVIWVYGTTAEKSSEGGHDDAGNHLARKQGRLWYASRYHVIFYHLIIMNILRADAPLALGYGGS